MSGLDTLFFAVVVAVAGLFGGVTTGSWVLHVHAREEGEFKVTG